MPLSISYPTVKRSLQKIVPAEKSDSASDQKEDNKESVPFVEQFFLLPRVTNRTEGDTAGASNVDSVNWEGLLQVNPCKLIHLNQFFRA